MKKSLVLGLLAVAVCSLAVYAEEAGLGDKVKAKTESTSATVQQKAENVNTVAEATGNAAIKEKSAKATHKAKAKAKKAEKKIVNKVDEVSAVKKDVATSTTAVVK